MSRTSRFTKRAIESTTSEALAILDQFVLGQNGRFKAVLTGGGVRVVEVVDSQTRPIAKADGVHLEEAIVKVSRRILAGVAEPGDDYWAGSSDMSYLDQCVMELGDRLDVYTENSAVFARILDRSDRQQYMARLGRAVTSEAAIVAALNAKQEPVFISVARGI